MKIRVVPRQFIETQMLKNSFWPNWPNEKYIISIFSKGSFSPCFDGFNILKLEFDDVTERDYTDLKDRCIFFNETHAKQIHQFIENIKDDGKKDFYVHCDAGVSRSGAVGYILNEYFNKFITNNMKDNEFFKENNKHILPNPLVVRILKEELFGKPFAGIEVNDYEYNEDGERIDHKETI